MRVSDNVLTRNYLLNINNGRARMSKLHDQLSTGKRVSTPSDDPAAANKILRFQNALAKNEQYQKNVDDGTSIMEATAHALDSFSDLMLEAKDVLTKARSGGRTQELGTLADQIDQLLTNAVQTANTQLNGKYLFGGTQTTNPPFILAANRSAVTLNPNGITGKIEIPINEGTTQVVNIDGQEAFLGTQIFQVLIDVRDAMRNGVVPTAAQFDAVNAHLTHVAGVGGKAGSTMNTLAMNEKYLEERNILLADLLSREQDTDFAEATLQLRKEETMFEAALSIGARLLPKTLMDFLN